MRVVIVDDANSLRSALKALLRHEGYDVVADLGSGHKLLETIASLHPQIVCLDINLPDSDGMELLKEIHANHRDIAVVMITGSGDYTLEQQAAEAGAAGFIKKPFSQEMIVRELAQVAHAQWLLLAANFDAHPLPADTPMRRAVIADDSATMRQLLTAILTQAGVLVVGEGHNGQEAVDLANEHRPDLICLDCNMPVMSGPDALRLIHPQHPDCKVLMISSLANRELILETASAGASGYILKPYRPDKIIEAVNRLFAS